MAGGTRQESHITVVGGGIFGLSCAWELLRRGTSVRLLEARHIGAGASGGHVGALAPHVPDNWNPKKAFQLDSLLIADQFWADVEAAANMPTGYGRTGRIQPIADPQTAGKLAPRIAASARRWPVGTHMRLTGSPGTALAPHSPSGLWLEDRLSARLDPRAALRALSAAIRNRGGKIYEGAVGSNDQGTTLWATGCDGLRALGADLGREIGAGVKGQSALLDFAAPDAPQIFADGLHIVPHANGTVAVGSTSENAFTDLETDAQLDALILRVRQICPQLARAPVIDRWAGLRPRARSRAPLLGPWPGRSGHFVANGGFKIGFGMAPKVAAIMADLLLEGKNRIPQEFLTTEPHCH